MEGRIGLLFLTLLVAAWACDARELVNPDTSEQTRRPDICTLCEEYTAKALIYLTQNKTQEEIIDYLHNACHQLHSFQQQCITLVDYYGPLFFLEVVTVQPADFCKKVNLCEQIAKISSQIQEDSCGLCKDTVAALMTKLKDPETQVEIIETLMKACNSMEKYAKKENYAKKCKRLVFEYGPVILVNAEKFLETTDLCSAIHACKSHQVDFQEVLAMEEIPLLSES